LEHLKESRIRPGGETEEVSPKQKSMVWQWMARPEKTRIEGNCKKTMNVPPFSITGSEKTPDSILPSQLKEHNDEHRLNVDQP
jgi:hypothetical protein